MAVHLQSFIDYYLIIRMINFCFRLKSIFLISCFKNSNFHEILLYMRNSKMH